MSQLPTTGHSLEGAPLSDADRALLRRVKAAVLAVEPSAEVILYGSRARGDAHAESDWDLLVLVDGPVNLAREDAIWDRVFPIELETSQVLTVVTHDRHEWNEGLQRITPFHASVTRDGVQA